MKDLHLIVVGKLADKNISELENDYLKRILTPKFYLHEVKSHSENLDLEAREVKNKINEISKNDNPFIVLLTENGKQFDSREFSKWIFEKNISQKIIFIIGGAAGHGEEIIKLAHFKLSLSLMTFPHKLARLLMVEQIYRAVTIKDGHPYHK
jgi:23S rRNA (pseudouridine1915-N3)-methyltransferase